MKHYIVICVGGVGTRESPEDAIKTERGHGGELRKPASRSEEEGVGVKETSVKFVLPQIVTSIPIQELGLALIGLRLEPPTDFRDAMVCVAIMIKPGVVEFGKRGIQFESTQGL